MSLKIIGAGFPRTGTLSLKAALEILGYGKCLHMSDVLFSPKQVSFWHDISEGEPTDWDVVFDGYQSCVDFPAALYYRELHAKYPEAKVILTVRPPEVWYDSMLRTLYQLEKAVPAWLQMLFPRVGRLADMADRLVWNGLFEGQFTNPRHAITEYERHIDDVKHAIPRGQLLVMDVKDGWAPLCVFLGVPEPDMPFPRVNDKAEFQKLIKRLKQLSYLPVVLTGILVAGFAVAGWFVFNS